MSAKTIAIIAVIGIMTIIGTQAAITGKHITDRYQASVDNIISQIENN